MSIRLASAFAIGSLFASVMFAQTAPAPIVRFHTNLGDMDVTLIPSSAPKTVENFLKYVNRGSYNNSIFHRSVRNFVIQGGGFQLQDHKPVAIKDDGKVVNEYSQSNIRGTLAMAKVDGDPNSATTQWFFNLGNNSSSLNTSNGGYTVFGRVNSAAGLTIMDKIAAVPIINLDNATFAEIPLINYPGGTVPDESYVQILSLSILQPPSIKGIASATSFGGFNSAAPGSFIEIYGSDLAGTNRGWATDDFVNGNAPVTLDGVIVTVDGRQAYVNYVSSTQVNVQVPADISTDKAVPVIVYYKNQSSASASLNIKSLAPGLLAPATFKVGDKQYVVAVHSSGAFVSNGNIPDIPAAPALPGETLVFYGVGFGPVSPSSVPVAGKVIEGATALSTPVQFKFGDTTGEVLFSGLTQGLVGVYQFNVKVPANVPNGDVPLTVLLGSDTVPQTLIIPVKN